MRLFRPTPLALLVCAAVVTAARSHADSPAPSALQTVTPIYRYAIALDAKAERLDIEWSQLDSRGEIARAGQGGAPLHLCLMMSGMGRFVRGLLGGADAKVPFKVDSDDDDCFNATLPAGAAITARYSLDMEGSLGSHDDADFISRDAAGYVIGDKAILLRPDPSADAGLVEATWKLPEGMSVAPPWERVAGKSNVFRFAVGALDCGGYTAVGKVRALPEIKVRGGVMAPVLLDGPHKATDQELTAWVAAAANQVADFYERLPRPRVHVVLVPVPRQSDGGVFGTVMRHGPTPSAELLFGAEASGAAAFAGDWVATHELFHLGNPETEGKVSWFVEGFTTYYQDVLRGRAKTRDPLVMWADLYDEFHRHCDGWFSLSGESKNMRKTYRYTRVYWGGACVAFQTDVAIRRRTNNKESLDTVMRAMLAEGREQPFDEEAVVKRLDKAAGGHLVRDRVFGKSKSPLGALFKELGVEPIGEDTVKLHDDAPLSAIRRSIF